MAEWRLGRREISVKILRWYGRNGRDLPWRKTRDPYKILLSEIMLQQTQVSRVLKKYPLFLQKFPTFAALARARQSSVVRAWQGMGYNNRAVRLHRLAQAVMQEHHGILPDTAEKLAGLPGIGPYTANALMAFVFNKPALVIDVNIRRVLSRLARRMKSTADTLSDRDLRRVAAQLLPRRSPHDWYQALMDLGATVCTARTPQCPACPVATLCASRPAMVRGVTRTKRPERLTDGLPDRIYRGRVIEVLRNLPDRRAVRLSALGKQIRPGFMGAHMVWLKKLVVGLESDNLVRIEPGENGGRVSLA
jgi:A/G-specific adenine glycosylase